MNLPRHARVLVLAVAAVALIMSPWGNVGLHDLESTATSAFNGVGEAFLAMFPGAVEVAPLPASQTLDVGLGLSPANDAGLNAFIQSTETVNSPNFHQFLTPSQFDQQYSPSAASYATDVQYFGQFGLHVQTTSNRLLLGVAGSPQEMGAAFHTSFAEFALNGASYYGPTSTPTLPSDLTFDGTFGTTNAFDYEPQYTVVPSDSTAAPAGTAASCSGGLTPTEVQDAYQINKLISAGDEGSGYGIAVVDAYDTAQKPTSLTTDINDFDTDCGVASITPQYQYPVPFPSSVNSSASSEWGEETTLDMQWSHAQAQDAKLYPVQTPDSGFSLYEAVDYLVDTHVADVISLSWGEPTIYTTTTSCTEGCNASWSGSYETFHPVLQAAVAEGISVTVASGDCGADDGSTGVTTDYPASDEDATGIGGSVLTMASNDTWYGSESTTGSGWSGNESTSCANGGAAGGGWAPTPQPWYQSGPGIVNKGLRGVPDVGITVGTALATYYGGAGGGVYGTSDGAPQWAGLIATADGIAGHDVGLINPALYAMLRSPLYTYYFHEVTTGSGNGYSPTSDWDPISGVGTPYASHAIPYIASGGYLPTTTSLQSNLSASVTSGTAPLTVTFTMTVSGGTGTYPLYNFYWGNEVSASTHTKVLSYTYTAAGTYAAQAEVYDSSGNSSTTPAIMITVGTTPTMTLSLAASTTSPSVGQSVTFTGTATGGTSPYTFGYYFGDGAYATGLYKTAVTSPNTVTHAFEAAGVYCADATVNDSSSPQQGATSNVLTILVGGASGTCPGGSSNPLSITATATPSSGTAALAVSFGSSPSGGSGTYTTFAWHFGDGTTGATQNPSHTYSAAGTYSAWVNVTDSSSATAKSNVLTITVSATSPLTMKASGTPLTGSATLNVAFTGAPTGGTGTYTTFLWHFGDGTTGSTQSPSHPYTTPGTYYVWANVTDSSSTTAMSNVLTVVVSGGTSALTMLASGSPLSGAATLDVSFTGTPNGGTGSYSTFFWHFGDGTTGSTQSPTHPYTSAGTYYVWGNVTDSGGTTAMSNVLTVVVSAPPPALKMTASGSPLSGVDPFTVDFTGDPSGGTGTYTTFLWHFGDGTTGATESPSHPYSNPGTFYVWANVTDSGAVTAMSNVLVVTVLAPVTATISDSASSAETGQAVSFTSQVGGGAGGYTYAWSFGDSSSPGTSADPSHTYSSVGTYTVSLTATDSEGNSGTSNSLTVTVTAPPQVTKLTGTLTVSTPSVQAGSSVTFSANPTGGTSPYRYGWSFLPPGCNGANQAAITCDPQTPGQYEVSVEVVDSGAPSQVATLFTNLTVTASSSGSGSNSASSSNLPLGLSMLQVEILVAAAIIGAIGVVAVAAHARRRPPEGGAPGADPSQGVPVQDLGGYLNQPPSMGP